uniref:Rpn family recombination-promoting nuclease/putative transposase n=1 Tax=Gracilibacillus timonensis TaxID=1816696 RepID=UPI000A4E023F
MLTAVKEDTHDYRSAPPDYDGLWKNIIQELFQEFMAFFAPDLYPDIDFDKGVDFEGTELLPHILRQAKGKRYTDKLAKVTLKNGENQYVHIHIEVQAVENKKFARRMFPYFYRIYENHTEPIYAIALLTDASEANYENQFHDAFYGTEITYRYNTYHFYGKDEEELKQSPNPFALVVLAGIYASKKIKIKDEHKKSKEQKKQEREET